MSTSRGNQNRNRPQKHQNRTAFKNDLHDTSKKTKFLNSLEVSGVCKRCKEIIEWKIKYKKYKALNAPSKCVSCEEKAVKYAYHVLCGKCAKDKHVCAKCNKPIDKNDTNEEIIDANQNSELKLILKSLPERKRRTILRFMDQNGLGDCKAVPAELLAKIKEINLGDDDDLDDSSSDESIHTDK